jgi:hypothetical protein
MPIAGKSVRKPRKKEPTTVKRIDDLSIADALRVHQGKPLQVQLRAECQGAVWALAFVDQFLRDLDKHGIILRDDEIEARVREVNVAVKFADRILDTLKAKRAWGRGERLSYPRAS